MSPSLPLFLATTASDATGSTSWIALSAIGLLLAVGLNFFALVRMANGKANERQIEPTQLAALQAEMRNNHLAAQAELRLQTTTLAKLDREMGGVSASMSSFQREIAEIKVNHSRDIEGVHSRLGGISRELSSTTARVDGIEKRETVGT
jgi:uncharacterized protein HemX